MFSVLVNDNNVSSVLEFMKQYEGRLASLDERLIDIQNDKCKLTEERQVLVTKAAEVDPNTIKKKSEIIRYFQCASCYYNTGMYMYNTCTCIVSSALAILNLLPQQLSNPQTVLNALLDWR